MESVVSRLWRGWTTAADAEEYAVVLNRRRREQIGGAKAGQLARFVLSRPCDDGMVEWVIHTIFESQQAMAAITRDYAARTGKEDESALSFGEGPLLIKPDAIPLLIKPDMVARHYHTQGVPAQLYPGHKNMTPST